MLASSILAHFGKYAAVCATAAVAFAVGLTTERAVLKNKPNIPQITRELTAGSPPHSGFGWYHDYRLQSWQAYPQHGSIVFLGDSLTEYGPWGTLLPGLAIINQGISGDTLDALISRIHFAYDCGAHVAVVTIGTNDVMSGKLDPDLFLAKWTGLIEAMSRNGFSIIATSIPATKSATFNKTASSINSRLKEHCARGRCRYVDLNAVLAPSGIIDSNVTLDGVHFTVEAYKVWAAQLAPHLSP